MAADGVAAAVARCYALAWRLRAPSPDAPELDCATRDMPPYMRSPRLAGDAVMAVAAARRKPDLLHRGCTDRDRGLEPRIYDQRPPAFLIASGSANGGGYHPPIGQAGHSYGGVGSQLSATSRQRRGLPGLKARCSRYSRSWLRITES